MKTLRLRYTGNVCAACGNKIVSRIEALDGVHAVSLSVLTHLLRLEVDEAKEAAILSQSKTILETTEPGTCLLI